MIDGSKRTWTTVLLCLLLATPLSAKHGWPDWVYMMDELEKAQQEARTKKLAIVFIHTRLEDGTNDFTIAQSLEIAKTLKDFAVIVFEHSHNDDGKLPEFVRNEIPTNGRFIPKTFVVDAEIKELIAKVPQEKNGNDRKRKLQAAIKAIKEYLAKNPATASSEVQAPMPESMVCSTAVDAFDLAAHTQRIGTFQSGTKLKLSPSTEPGMVRVTFEDPNGKTTEALCSREALMR